MGVNSGGEQRGESTGGQGWTLESSGGKKVRLRCGPEAQPRGPTGRRCPLLRAQLRGRRPQALTSEPREALGVGRGALLFIQSGTTTAPGRRTDLRASAWGPVLTRSPRGQAGWGVGHHRGRAGVRSEVLAGGGRVVRLIQRCCPLRGWTFSHRLVGRGESFFSESAVETCSSLLLSIFLYVAQCSGHVPFLLPATQEGLQD